MPGHLPAHVNYLADRVSVTGAKVEDLVLARDIGLKRKHVRVSEVANVDVIANTRAILGWPVIPENHDFVAIAHRHVKHQRDEVGFCFVVLSNLTVRARNVEVTQACRPNPVGRAVGGYRIVDGEFGCTVRVGRPRRISLKDGN
ncbi:Uncharacterised protein [Chlamydia trachomatis]|nr:Uncharacterised protein [Chlamydia trachomatis]